MLAYRSHRSVIEAVATSRIEGVLLLVWGTPLSQLGPFEEEDVVVSSATTEED